ncbi:MAG TPA: phytoene/squalene synthase family protein [Chryseosolibacter sp.]|nr:phytoene/squalene synthase family protein [Chryseosolibacter sp.]
MKKIFDQLSMRCSRLTTQAYSTSFSLGVGCLEKKLRNPIHSIYGFVRFADEIVDSFHGYDKGRLLTDFREQTRLAIDARISINPILNSFQETVHRYRIDPSLIDQFFSSMEMDLEKRMYNADEYDHYILGSAEVVGLMCLRVFSHDQPALYTKLAPYAMKLGAAFQKVNFLRDLKTDYMELGRTYFPGVEALCFDDASKKGIEESISRDFSEALKGIQLLPAGSRFGVYVAYVYYLALFRKIRNTPSELIMKSRIRIRNTQKATLLAYSFVKYQLNRI